MKFQHPPQILASQDDDLSYGQNYFFAVVISLTAIAIFLWCLELLEHTNPGIFYVDFTTWKISFETDSDLPKQDKKKTRQFLASLQPKVLAERRFKLALQMPRIPKLGDRMIAKGWLPLKSDIPMCLNLYIYHPTKNQKAEEIFEVILDIAGHSHVLKPFGKPYATAVQISDISASTDSLPVSISLRALVTTKAPSWQKHSRVEFQFMMVKDCP